MERESDYILSIESLNVHVDGLCYLRWATVCSGEYPNVLLNLVYQIISSKFLTEFMTNVVLDKVY